MILTLTLLALTLQETRAIHDYASGESNAKPELGTRDWKDVREVLRAWTPSIDGTGEEAERSHTLSNGHEATFYYYVPKSYERTKPAPLAVFLHGGVSGAQPKRGRGQCRVWQREADERGWIVCAPSGTDKCLWWASPGEEHIVEAIRYLSARYAIDRNRVIVSGFSDGASGAYYLGMARTDLWSAVIPWNGAVGVVTAPQAGNSPFYTLNCRGASWRATHGGKDQLYPSASQAPVIDQLKAAGVRIDWKNFEDVGHEGGKIINDDKAFLADWLPKQKRDPLPAEVDWMTHDAAGHGQAWWLRICEIGDRPGDPFTGEKDYTFPVGQTGPPRPVLGVQIDQSFRDGVRVAGVSDGSGAMDAGVKEGDIIVEAAGKTLATFDDLRGVLSKVKSGDTVKLKISRENKEFELDVTVRPIEIKATAVAAPGRVRATRRGNTVEISTKRVVRLEILVSPDAFDLEKEIVVTVNSRELHRAVVRPDAQFMLEEMRRRAGDASVPYVARIVVEIAARKDY